MKKYALLLLLIQTILYSQNAKTVSPIKIDDVNNFFRSFIRQNVVPERGEFESLEEYQKRLPKPYDSTKIIYFNMSTPYPVSDKSYNYDYERKLLSFTGGKFYNGSSRDYNPEYGIPIEICYKYELAREYIASNSFGHSVKVEEHVNYHYVINFLNIDALPDSIFDIQLKSFHFNINRPPKEADQLSKRLSLIIGVRPISPSKSVFECVLHEKPTIDNPIELSSYLSWIDAKFVSLILYDTTTKKIICRYDL